MKNSSKLKNQLRIQRQIKTISKNIDSHLQQTSKSLFELGRCFYELQKIMSWQELVTLAKIKWGLSRMSLQRLIQTHIAFQDHRKTYIAKAKPSVLYLLAAAVSDSDVKHLISGRNIDVGGVSKNIESLTVKDAQLIKNKNKSNGMTTIERERQEAGHVHHKLATAIEGVDDIGKTIFKLLEKKVEIKETRLLKKYLRVAIERLKIVEAAL